jgi:ketosteroid isomerase-like protein
MPRPTPLVPAALLLVVMLAACAARPPAPAGARATIPEELDAPRAELLAAERALFAAFAHRDQAAFEQLVGDDFVLRMPGSPDVGRAAFLASIPRLPPDILSVEGAELDARVLAPDLGVVSGVQIARVRVDGKEVVDRGAFTDVFRRAADGRWQAVFAHTIPLPAPPAAAP